MFLFFLAAVIVCSHCGAGEVSKQNEDGSSLCPDHWIDATLSGLGCLFFNSTTTATWLEAAELCQHPDNNASLVEIWSELQLDFIRSELMFLQDNGVDSVWWTGATDLGREGHWYWAGSLATVGDFIWYTNQPNDGTKGNCLWLEDSPNYEFLGVDAGCIAYDRYFICQKR